MSTTPIELARDVNEIRAASFDTWVPISDEIAKFLRCCNGALVCKIFTGNAVGLYAPLWAYAAASHAWSCKSAMRQLIQRAHRDLVIREALTAALDGDLVVQLALAQRTQAKKK